MSTLESILEIVNKLPQRDLLDDADIRRWVDDTVRLHGDQAIWHAIRLNGFGGSEIGVLVRNAQGVRADHQASAHEICEHKLMRRVPQESTGPMQRGHENEEPHRQKFYRKYGIERDETAFVDLSRATGLRPWMRYSPDDVVATYGGFPGIGDAARKQRWLIDYKAPSQVEDSDTISFQYACQLHQGAIICASNGIELDGLMLSQFDWANWSLKDDVVPYDRDLSRQVIAAGDLYWNDYVMKGAVPPYVTKARMDATPEFIKENVVLAEYVATVKSLVKSLEANLTPAEATLKSHLESFRLGNQRLSIGQLQVSTAQSLDMDAMQKLFTADELIGLAKDKKAAAKYDTDAVVAKLKELGVDVKAYRKVDIDPERAYAVLIEKGADGDACIKESLRMKASQEIEANAKAWAQANFPIPKAHGADGEGDFENRDGQEFTERSAPRSQAA